MHEAQGQTEERLPQRGSGSLELPGPRGAWGMDAGPGPEQASCENEEV